VSAGKFYLQIEYADNLLLQGNEMQKPSFTQNDLKSALQKVTSFKFLEPQVTPLLVIEPSPEPVAIAVMEEPLFEEVQIEESKNEESIVGETALQQSFQPDIYQESITENRIDPNEVTILKDIVEELSGKLSQKEIQLKQQTIDAAAKQEALDTQLKQAKLERDKATELELERYKQIIEELKASQLKIVPTHDPIIDQLQRDLQEQKSKAFRFLTEKKELEARLSQENCEKETILARLKELSRKTEHKDELQAKLKEAVATLVATEKVVHTLEEKISFLEQEKEKAYVLSQKLQSELEKSIHSISEFQKTQTSLQNQLEADKKSYQQELMVSQACVVERQAAVDTEQKRYRLLANEHAQLEKDQQHLLRDKQLIEQHLARRVKECLQLEKQLEEEKTRHSALQISHTEQLQKNTQLETALEQHKKHEEYERQEFIQKCASYEERLSKLQERYDTLYAQNQADLNELLLLRKLKERLQQLEQLFVQFSQIVTSPILAPPIFSTLARTQEAILHQELP
jgi:hypothetical protein